MKNKKDMIKWLNNLKSDIGQPQHSQLWHYTEILDVIARYLESTERPKGKWEVVRCGECERWECILNTKNYGLCRKVSYDDCHFEVVMERDDFCSYGIRRNEIRNDG